VVLPVPDFFSYLRGIRFRKQIYAPGILRSPFYLFFCAALDWLAKSALAVKLGRGGYVGQPIA